MKPLHYTQVRAMLVRLRGELYDLVARSPEGQPQARGTACDAIEHTILACSQLWDSPVKEEPKVDPLPTLFTDDPAPTNGMVAALRAGMQSAHAIAEVRWIIRRNMGTTQTILQQKWLHEFSGDYEWRDVPYAKEE